MCATFPFGFVCGLLNLLVIVPDHCLSFYLHVSETVLHMKREPALRAREQPLGISIRIDNLNNIGSDLNTIKKMSLVS